MDWLWWLGAAILLGLVEILTLDLVFVMFAGGALAAAGVNAAGGPVWLQIIAFAVVSAALLVGLRPWLLRHLRTRVPLTETNASALVGRDALVVEAVGDHRGLVKLAGEVWSARTATDAVELPVGAEVRVVRIDGATAVVQDAAGTPSAGPRQGPGTDDAGGTR